MTIYPCIENNKVNMHCSTLKVNEKRKLCENSDVVKVTRDLSKTQYSENNAGICFETYKCHLYYQSLLNN